MQAMVFVTATCNGQSRAKERYMVKVKMHEQLVESGAAEVWSSGSIKTPVSVVRSVIPKFMEYHEQSPFLHANFLVAIAFRYGVGKEGRGEHALGRSIYRSALLMGH
jgi:hypothetical protein